MKYLFCNRVNYVWAGFVLSILLSNVAVLTLLHTGLIQEVPNETLALVFASLVVSPLMQLARKRWYPEADQNSKWELKWADARIFVLALLMDCLARGSAAALLSMLSSIDIITPALTQGISLVAYALAAILIGRYLTQRIQPAPLLEKEPGSRGF